MSQRELATLAFYAHDRAAMSAMPDQDLETQDQLAMMQVVAVATDPSVKLDVQEIASKTGLPVEQVQRVLCSEAYRAMMEGYEKRLLDHTLARAMRAMDDIVSDPDATQKNKIAAAGAIGRLYTAAHNAADPQPHDPADDLDGVIAKLKPKLQVQKAT